MTPFSKTALETLLTREATAPGLAQVVVEHYGATGTSFLREQELLDQGGSNRRYEGDAPCHESFSSPVVVPRLPARVVGSGEILRLVSLQRATASLEPLSHQRKSLTSNKPLAAQLH